MKIDETTGLPELPEGHIWVVTDDTEYWNGQRYIYVSKVQVIPEYVTKVTLPWWKLGGSYNVTNPEKRIARGTRQLKYDEVASSDDPQALIRETAEKLILFQEKQEAERQKMQALTGDYPPKKLG